MAPVVGEKVLRRRGSDIVDTDSGGEIVLDKILKGLYSNYMAKSEHENYTRRS